MVILERSADLNFEKIFTNPVLFIDPKLLRICMNISMISFF